MRNTPLFRYSVLLLAILLCLAVLLLSILPASRAVFGARPVDGSSATLIQRTPFLHAAVHIVVYGALACAVWFALRINAAGTVNKLIGLITLSLFGCGSEYLQHRLYDKLLDITDVLINIFSIAAVFGLLYLWSRFRKRPPEAKLEGEHVAYVLRDIE